MKNRIKCMLCMMLALLTLCPVSLAELSPESEVIPAETDTPVARPTAIPDSVAVTTQDGSFPDLNAAGFMDEGEFVYQDATAGIWRYCSPTLKVEIIRHQTTSPKMVWYEA